MTFFSALGTFFIAAVFDAFLLLKHIPAFRAFKIIKHGNSFFSLPVAGPGM
jgi:hypothetical protein